MQQQQQQNDVVGHQEEQDSELQELLEMDDASLKKCIKDLKAWVPSIGGLLGCSTVEIATHTGKKPRRRQDCSPIATLGTKWSAGSETSTTR